MTPQRAPPRSLPDRPAPPTHAAAWPAAAALARTQWSAGFAAVLGAPARTLERESHPGALSALRRRSAAHCDAAGASWPSSYSPGEYMPAAQR